MDVNIKRYGEPLLGYSACDLKSQKQFEVLGNITLEVVHVMDTIIIKNLPCDLNDNDKEELLKYFGAKHVKCLSSNINKCNIVFARFQNEEAADLALRRLHQLKINELYLSVEFSKKENISVQNDQHLKELGNKEVENDKCYKEFVEKLNSWCSNVSFKQPVPSHLRYQYPPPNNAVLLNIAKTLATVPKFYTQVLHLMNKMNLPCPFGKDILPGFNMQIFTNSVESEKNSTNIEMEVESKEVESGNETSESEISSDDDAKLYKEMIPDKVRVRKKKVINVPKFVKPILVTQGSTKPKKTRIDEVFEKVSEEKEAKKIKLNHPSDTIQKTIPVKELPESASGFGFIHPVAKTSSPTTQIDLRDEREEERLEKVEIKCISIEELTQNRIPEKDRSILPVFKNYAEGAPTSRLYIKNLAKTVTVDDLLYIYNRYLPKQNLEQQSLDIRLMQEGRMKGQAFIGFHSVQLAQTALKETNGYLLNEKPLVVQFARSASK